MTLRQAVKQLGLRVDFQNLCRMGAYVYNAYKHQDNPRRFRKVKEMGQMVNNYPGAWTPQLKDYIGRYVAKNPQVIRRKRPRIRKENA